MKTSFFLLVFGLFSLSGSSQVSFIFNSNFTTRRVDELSMVQLLNSSGGKLVGTLRMELVEKTTKKRVLRLVTPSFELNKGTNSIPTAIYSRSQIEYFELGQAVKQTGQMGAGQYSLCFYWVSQIEQDDCTDVVVEPLAPIELLLPDDKDKICLKRPDLSWQPPMPTTATMRYRLLLTEHRYSSPTQSLLLGLPIVSLDNIPANSIRYPTSAPDLQEGKTYCWQVVAFDKGMVVSTSEIFTFTVSCKEASSLLKDSYRELKYISNGNYYLTDGVFRFLFNNLYNVPSLHYEVLDVSNRNEAIAGLPKIKLKSGANQIDVDLNNYSLNEGKQYILVIKPFNQPEERVLFTYKE